MGQARIFIDYEAAKSMLMLPNGYKVTHMEIKGEGFGRVSLIFWVESDALSADTPGRVLVPWYERVETKDGDWVTRFKEFGE